MYTTKQENEAMWRLNLDVELSKHTDESVLQYLTPDDQEKLAYLLMRVQGKPRKLIGPAWKCTRRHIGQLFAGQGSRVQAAGVTYITSTVHAYLGLDKSDLCMAMRDEVVARWAERTLETEPVDG